MASSRSRLIRTDEQIPAAIELPAKWQAYGEALFDLFGDTDFKRLQDVYGRQPALWLDATAVGLDAVDRQEHYVTDALSMRSRREARADNHRHRHSGWLVAAAAAHLRTCATSRRASVPPRPWSG